MGKTTAKPKAPSKTTKAAKAVVTKKSSRAAVKAVVRKSAPAPGIHYSSTPEWVRTTLEAMKEHDRRVAADPMEARRFLIKMGLMTKGGKLTKRYGG